MTPLKPYLIRSIYEWIIDNNLTPHLLVDADNCDAILPQEFIEDGKIVKRDLPGLNLTEEWINKQLKKNGVNSVEQVFYAELESDGSVYMDLRDDNLNSSR
jgi:stringent starvation protein B